MPADPAHRLVVVEGRSRGAELRLGPDAATVGRGLGNDLVVDDPRVSRRHLQVRAHGGAVMVEDLGSHNGTRVAGLRLVGPRVVPAGERIAIGRTTLLVGPGAPASSGVPAVPAPCRRARALLERDLDGELDPAARGFLHGHLGDCPRCRARSDLAATWRAIVDTALAEPLPPGLAERIGRALDGAGTS